MKEKALIIPVSFILSIIILFGSWHLYHSYALEDPLAAHVQQIEGVNDSNVVIDKQDVIIQLELALDADVRAVFQQIHEGVSTQLNDRNVQIEITNPTSDLLDEWWSRLLFDIAEAMETKQYGQIPKLLEEHKDSLPQLQVYYDLDDMNVYVRLVHEQEAKFIILPRTPHQYVGWSHG